MDTKRITFNDDAAGDINIFVDSVCRFCIYHRPNGSVVVHDIVKGGHPITRGNINHAIAWAIGKLELEDGGRP